MRKDVEMITLKHLAQFVEQKKKTKKQKKKTKPNQTKTKQNKKLLSKS